MVFDVLAVTAPLFIGLYLSATYFYPFYKTEPYLLLPVFVLCALSALCISLPALGRRSKVRFTLSMLFPFAFCFSAVTNAVVSVWITVIAAASALLYLPKKRKYEFIDFAPSGEMLITKRRADRTLRHTYIFATNVLMLLFLILSVFTLCIKSPSRIWQAHLFPIDLSEKPLPGDCAVPSGNVTATLWYGDDILLVAGFFDIGSAPSPCEEAGIKEGDIVTEINGESALSSSFIINGATESPAVLTVLRANDDGESFETLSFTITPLYSEDDGVYRIGMTYYSGASLGASVQTLSFYYPDTGLFAATAHSSDPLLDNVYNLSGALSLSTVTGRDEDGLTVEGGDIIGEVAFTNDYGAFGTLSEASGEALPIAKKSEIRRGRAAMLSSFEGGEVKEYDVYITGTYRIDGRDVITLLAEDERIVNFGGVTRGMSGSPIIQNGMLIGALSNMDAGGYSAYATFAYDMASVLTDMPLAVNSEE